MKNKKIPQASGRFAHVLVFLIGIAATLAYRLIIVFSGVSVFWLEVVWYFGTVGFIAYFWHRWNIERRREGLIEEMDLIKKVESGQPLAGQDQEAVAYILKGLRRSLARWNYVIIFTSSFLAIGYAIWRDLAR